MIWNEQINHIILVKKSNKIILREAHHTDILENEQISAIVIDLLHS